MTHLWEMKQMQNDDEVRKAKLRAMKLLERRDYTEAGLRRKLMTDQYTVRPLNMLSLTDISMTFGMRRIMYGATAAQEAGGILPQGFSVRELHRN